MQQSEPHRQASPVPGIYICGVLLFVFGMATAVLSWSLGFGQPSQPGPGFFPFLSGVGICLLAMLSLLRLWSGGGESSIAADSPSRNALLAMAALWGYVEALPYLGFAIATCILMTVLFRLAGVNSWARSVGLGAAFGIAAAVGFDALLGGLELPGSSPGN